MRIAAAKMFDLVSTLKNYPYFELEVREGLNQQPKLLLHLKYRDAMRSAYIKEVVTCEAQLYNPKKWVIIVDESNMVNNAIPKRAIRATRTVSEKFRVILNSKAKKYN